MKKLLAFALATVALAGCMSNEDPYYKIKVVTPNTVVGCKLIGNLTASSKNFGLFNETAEKERIRNAKQSGYNLGATHIVLDPQIENGNTTITTGKAYSCPYGS